MRRGKQLWLSFVLALLLLCSQTIWSQRTPCLSSAITSRKWKLESTEIGFAPTFSPIIRADGIPMAFQYTVSPNRPSLLIQASIYGATRNIPYCATEYRIVANNQQVAVTTANTNEYLDTRYPIIFHGFYNATAAAGSEILISVEYKTQCPTQWNVEPNLEAERVIIVESFDNSMIVAKSWNSTFSFASTAYIDIGYSASDYMTETVTTTAASSNIRVIGEISRLQAATPGKNAYVNLVMNGFELAYNPYGELNDWNYKQVSLSGNRMNVGPGTYNIRMLVQQQPDTSFNTLFVSDENGVQERRLFIIKYEGACANSIENYYLKDIGAEYVTSITFAPLPTPLRITLMTSEPTDTLVSAEINRVQQTTSETGDFIVTGNNQVLSMYPFPMQTALGARFRPVQMRGLLNTLPADTYTIEVQAKSSLTLPYFGMPSGGTGFNSRRIFAIVHRISCFGYYFNEPNVCSSHGACESQDNCFCSDGYTGANCEFAICNGGNSGALKLDGLTDYLEVAVPTTLDVEYITIEVYLNIESIDSSESTIIRKSSCANSPYFLALQNGMVVFSVNNAPTNQGAPITTGYHHIAGVYDGANRYIYIDGELKLTLTDVTGPIPIMAGSLLIGKSFCTQNVRHLNGSIDEIRIWNAARSAQDIESTMYSSEFRGDATLVAQWKFDDGASAATIRDYTNNENNAIRHGGKFQNTGKLACGLAGICTAVDTCECQSGYSGPDCFDIICNGKAVDDPSVCSGRGQCIAVDTCQCDTGFTGTDCQTPICFGIPASDSLVCSNNGTCVSNNTCICESEYVGDSCQIPVCFGLMANNTNVCSEKGTCVRANQCACHSGYYGNKCQDFDCFGTHFLSPEVCSRNGTCLAINTCICNEGWTGERCDIAICYGIASNNSDVCSGNGTCVAKDKCICNSGYTGSMCEIASCFSKLETDPAVCSGNGTCVKNDQCHCNAGYTGAQCEIPICFGKMSTDPTVCSHSNGTCVSKDNCKCDSGYAGEECQIPICYSVPANDSNTCNSAGQCVKANTCSCNPGYAGEQCELFICYGKTSDDPTVCSSNGRCTHPNNCSCNEGYTDLNCNMPTCFGLNASNPLVCTGNGSCVSPNNCSCLAGFSADGQCKHPLCYGRNSSDPAVCSSRGYCNGPDQCICQANFYGNNCESYNCFGYHHQNDSVCSSNGTCLSPDLCQCNEGYEGDNCQIPICFGESATNATVCSARNGTCVSKDNCICNAGYTGTMCEIPLCYNILATDTAVCSNNGTCVAKDSCVCNPGYTGSNCEIPICFGKNATDSLVCSNSNGTCVSKDNCLCHPNYTEPECQVPICFGVPSDYAAACSAAGQCVKANTCVCRPGYYGSNCQFFDCFGNLFYDSQVCHGRNGTCIAPNTCQCNAGYIGENCEIPTCFGVPSNDTTVCSNSNGTCVSKDTCSCRAGYTGSNCEVPICYGISGSDSAVCSNSNGTCIAADNCVCKPGYIGTQCEVPVCFGIPANDSSACNSNGTCIANDRCLCHPDFGGEQCQNAICFGIPATNPNACGGNGTCIRNNECRCNTGYYGDHCQHHDCFAVHYTNFTACSGRGKCLRPDVCSCDIGFTGSNCQVAICFNIAASNSSVCSGNGECTDVNQCTCHSTHTGYQCEIPICLGKNSSDPDVCSGNGQCSAPDSCSCRMGYIGSECQVPVCFGIPANTSQVCSNNGTCVAANSCACRFGYTGTQCELPLCFTKNASDPSSCSGNGLCIAPDTCRCAPGWKGDCSIMHCEDRRNCSSNGICIAPNTCNCTENAWTGIYCDIPVCYGLSASDNKNCSSHGSCISPDTCSCKPGYTGSRCELSVCFNITSNNATVCNGRGSCTTPNTCVCNVQYTGDQCQLFTCNGKQHTDPSACAGVGSCIAPDTCECPAEFGGNNCHIPKCYGILADSPAACGFGKGNCTAPNRCVCKPGYNGTQCTELEKTVVSCFGLASTDPSVCSGRGSCTAANTCSCRNGFNGAQCQFADCFGISSKDSFSVCSGNGECVDNNKCSCRAGYQGTKCEIVSCYGILSNSSAVCSSRGKCTSPDLCQCQSGYISDCSIAICFGKNQTDPSVCSGNGFCTAPNTCDCKPGTHGVQCEYRTCFDYLSTDSRVCSGNGVCTDVNTCSCSAGYSGPTCEISDCFGTLSNDAMVCGGRGKCIRPNQCVCDANWNGNSECNICSRNYEGRFCDVIKCDDASTCNNNGFCNADLTCTCFHNATTGYWNSTFCDKCQENYYGSDCKTKCVASQDCSGRGTCTAIGSCECFDTDEKGHFSGSRCDRCNDGFVGSSCKSMIPSNLTFSDSGDKLFGYLLLEEAQTDLTVSCSKIFTTATVNTFGVGSKCWWPKRTSALLDNIANRYFEVVFGSSATVLPGQLLEVSLHNYAIATLPPSNAVKPKAVISTPGVIGVCDGVLLDGSLSSSQDRRPLKYNWEAISGFNTSQLNAALALQKTQSVQLPSAILEPGYTYIFSLVVENYFGTSSEAAIVTVTKASSPVPIAQIRGPAVQSTSISAFFKLEGSALISSCFYEDREVSYTWRQTSGPQVNGAVISGRNLLFPAYTFPRLADTQLYTFELRVQPVANMMDSSTASVTVSVTPRALTAVIRGGGNRQVSTNETIELDGSTSFDPDRVSSTNDTFAWQCVDQFGGFCKFRVSNFSLPKTSTITIPRFALDVGTYNFTLFYSKGSRLSTAFTLISVIQGAPPRVLIRTSLPEKINREDKLVIVGSATVSDGLTENDLEFKWITRNSRGEVTLLPHWILTSLDQPILVLKPDVLEVGEKYEFTLTAKLKLVNSRRSSLQAADIVSGYATTELTTINQPPQPGLFEITPNEGTTLQTNFKLVCSQWVDQDQPLQYSFAYLQPDGTSVLLSKLSLANSVTLQLPSGAAEKNYSLTVLVRVVDSLGAQTTLSKTITVYPLPLQSTSSFLEAAKNQTTAKLDEVVNSGSAEAVSQLVSGIVQIINIPGTNNQHSPPPVPPTYKCTNNCNYPNGNCIADGVCKCVEPYTTKDCSITQEELRERQQLRTKLLSTLVQALNTTTQQEPLTKEDIAQQVSVVSQITNKPEELSSETKSLALNHLSNLVTASTPRTGDTIEVINGIDISVANAVGNALSNIAEVAFVQVASSNTTSELETRENAKHLAEQVTETVSKLFSAVVGNKVPGEEPTIISQPSLQIHGQRAYPQQINNLGVTMNQFDTTKQASKVQLPSTILSQLQKRTARSSLEVHVSSLSSIDVQAINYVGNPYSWSPNSQNISSSVVSFSLRTDQGEEIKVYNLSEPITILVPWNENSMDLQDYLNSDGDCLLTGSNVPSCRYWNTLMEDWSTDGCKLVNVTDSFAVCECNHLTDFAAFISYITPEMNILRPEDFKLLEKLNKDNFTTMSVMIALIGIYIIAFISGFLLDYKLAPRNYAEYAKRREAASQGRFRMFIERFKSGHLWLSFWFRPVSPGFTRPARATMILLIVMMTLMINALFFNTNQVTVTRTIIAGILSNLITLPPTIILRYLFKYTKPRWKVPKRHKTPVDAFATQKDYEMEDLASTVNTTSGEKQIAEDKPQPLSPQPLSPQPLLSDSAIDMTPQSPKQDTSFESSPVVTPLTSDDNSITSEQMSKLRSMLGKNKQEDSPTTPTATEDRKSLRKSKAELEIEERMKRRSQKRLSMRQSLKAEKRVDVKINTKANATVDKLDDVVDRVEIFLRRSVNKKVTPALVIALVLCILLYFAVVASACVMMAFVFPNMWPQYYSTAVAMISVLVLAVFFLFLYFSQKRERLRFEGEWKTTRMQIVAPCICIGLIVASMLLTVGVASGLKFWNSENAIIHVCIVLIGQVLLAACCVIFIIINLKKPKVRVYSERRYRIGYLPWWLILILYPVAWATIATCAVLLVVYGLKFGPNKERAWMNSSFLGIGQDLAFSKPFGVIIKAFFFSIVITLIRAVLFDWNIHIQNPEAVK